MKNNIELYNENFKLRFLEEGEYNKSTKETYFKILKSASKWELLNNRDIFTANSEDVKKILKILDNNSVSSANTKKTVLASYIDFAIEEGEDVPNGINHFKIISKEELKNFIGEIKKTSFITRYDIYNIPKKIKFFNYQDLVIPILLIESIEGAGMEEILYLMEEDINFDNNTITIRNKNNRNQIIRKVEDINVESIKIIKFAIEQDIYIRNVAKNKNFKMDADLVKSPFVIKKIKCKGVDQLTPVSKSTLANRLDRVIQEYMRKPHMAPYDIWKSGLYERIYLLTQEKGGKENLLGEDYINILQSFGRESQNYCDIKTSFELVYPYLDDEYKKRESQK